MAILFFSKGIRFSISNKSRISKTIQNLIKNEKKKEGDISFTFCSDSFLLDINKKFLRHNTLTDIITFQYPADKLSGEIFISIPRVRENAKKFNVSIQQELYRVIIHGVLHLCGYTDKNNSDKVLMSKREDYYLKRAAIK
ncbi:MAG TPA: rRNA maturation RNase YbeY [Bacteroidia bacterium]|jgi:probable rRNA maturation factor|nr:rRNA maturation RNase YbeY [Bacteroidia bacterium]